MTLILSEEWRVFSLAGGHSGMLNGLNWSENIWIVWLQHCKFLDGTVHPGHSLSLLFRFAYVLETKMAGSFLIPLPPGPPDLRLMHQQKCLGCGNIYNHWAGWAAPLQESWERVWKASTPTGLWKIKFQYPLHLWRGITRCSALKQTFFTYGYWGVIIDQCTDRTVEVGYTRIYTEVESILTWFVSIFVSGSSRSLARVLTLVCLVIGFVLISAALQRSFYVWIYCLRRSWSHMTWPIVGIYVEGLFSAISVSRSVMAAGLLDKVTPNSQMKGFAIEHQNFL